MNPTPECDCCSSTDCDACMASCEPQCSTTYYRKLKTDMQNGKELICTLKNYNIFDEHDTNPSPEFPYQTKRNNIKDKNKDSLGSPIGLAASNVNFKTEGRKSDMIKARFATYLKVLARLHLNSETSWNSAIIDDIMREGLLLYTKSEKEGNEIESSSGIYTSNEMNILREFELSGFTFHIELMPKLRLNKSAFSEREAKGDGNPLELTLKELKPALKEFFRQKKYCLLTVDSFYLMIWRLKEAYFIFDACGRRLIDLNSDEDKGVAMLICLSSLENVRHLIANLSGLQNEDTLLIREIKVVKIVTPSGTIMQRDYLTRTHQYQVVNDDYAYLKSSLHLTLNRRDLLRNRSSLPVAVSAIVASKIDHPATWDIQMTDKIICFGVNFCQNCWKKYTANEIIDVNEFVTFFNMGQFQITIDIVTHKYEGTWRCVPDFKHSVLAESIRRSFETGDQKLLVQINYQIYAVWKKNDFIYIFDPYRHRILGKQNESEIYKEMEKSATVRMFRSFEVFMNVFNHILLDSNRTSNFYIHVLKVKNIQRRHTSRMNEDIVKLNDRVKLDVADEIISINEHICFEEAENMCQKVLGEISDYEDEDLRSDVDEIELKTSSSEAEIIEEEEPTMEALEEIEGLETSSSGEEGGNYKRGQIYKDSHGTTSKDKSGKGKGHKGGDSKNNGQKGKGSTDKEGGGRQRKKGNQIKSEESSNDETRNTKKSKKIKIRGQVDENKSKGDKNNNKGNYKNKELQEDDQQKERVEDKEDKNESDTNKDDKNLKEKSKSKDSKSKNDEDKNVKDLEKDSGDNKSRANKDETSKNKRGKDEDTKENKNIELDTSNNKERKDLDKENIDILNSETNVSKETKDRQNPGKGHEKDLTNKDLKKGKIIVDSLKNNQDTKDEGKENKNQNEIENSTNDNNKGKKNQSSTQNPIKNNTNDQNKDEDLARNDGKDEKDKIQIEDSIKDNAEDKKDQSKVDNPTKNDSSKDEEDHGKIKGDKSLTNLSKYDDKNNIDDTKDEFTQDKGSKYDLNKGKLSNMANNKENDFSKDRNKLEDIGKDCDKVTSQHKMVKENHLKGTGIFDDGTEADDENEDDFFKKSHRYCLPNPDHYPGYLKQPVDMAIVGSENGSYGSICKLFQDGFKISDRILTITPCGNFVVFRCINHSDPKEKYYFLFDGCTCNFDYFRRLDLNIGTAGLIYFEHTHNIIKYIRCLCKSRRKERREQKYTADDICQRYYNRNYNIRL